MFVGMCSPRPHDTLTLEHFAGDLATEDLFRIKIYILLYFIYVDASEMETNETRFSESKSN